MRKKDKQEAEELNESVRHAIVQVDTQQFADSNFTTFECKQFELPGGLTVYDIEIDPVIIERNPNHISEDNNQDYFLSTLLHGKVSIQQADAEYTLEPGQLALIAGGLPYTTKYEIPSRRLIVRIPENVFKERLLSCHQNIVMGNLPSEGLGHIVNELLKSVAFEAQTLSITEQYTLTQSLLELTGALARSTVKYDDLKPVSKQSALLNRVYAYLEENFMDSDLTPEKVANANKISTRYLHSLFSQSGTTVLKWVWERRLRAARNDLMDPSQVQARISEIAFRRGFNDSAHFSRSFRNRFGISPTELRERAKQTKFDQELPDA
ncbi:MAG: helix-turn-helix domain-containing protein [Proteobacteria bacterium]|nr:helix-turn-helix domain-containing protein [Pseudomonadota bacterium]NOG59584.1 helix-turn-helix domain-containing protein [Pseudomonadota bacterium]